MDLNEKRVAVVMATFNGAQYLREQLISILQQTRTPDEIIVSDDGSTDQTIKIISDLALEHPSISILSHSGPPGVAANFNNALLHVSADIVFLSDQDDIWYNNKIEVMLQHFNNNKACYLLLCDADIQFVGSERAEQTKLDYYRDSGTRYFCTGCCMAMRKEILQLALPIPRDLVFHDVWINELAEAIGVKSVLDIALLRYRRHGINESNHLSSMPTQRWHFYRRVWSRRRKSQLSSDVTLSLLNELVGRLQENFDNQRIVKGEVWLNSLSLLEQRRDFETKRHVALNAGLLSRLGLLFKLLYSGGYQNYRSGVKAFIADLVL